jgi:cell division protein FtsB
MPALPGTLPAFCLVTIAERNRQAGCLRSQDALPGCARRSRAIRLHRGVKCHCGRSKEAAQARSKTAACSRGAMEITNQSPYPVTRKQDFAIHYGQSDVDTIREQIEQTEAMKRRWLFMAMIISIAALIGAIVLLSTNYALYSSSESDKKALVHENAALKSRADQTQQQLDSRNAQDARHAEARADAQTKLQTVLPAILRGNASPGEVSSFARMVNALPNSRVELDSKPPDKLFRNWKANAGGAIETYTLVGGFVDGKWVVYSNLVARK